MVSTLYSCGCVSNSDGNYCATHGRQFLIKSSESKLTKRRSIKEDVSMYQCAIKDFPFAFQAKDLVILDDVCETISDYDIKTLLLNSKARCFILDCNTASNDKIRALVSELSKVFPSTFKQGTTVLNIEDRHPVVYGETYNHYTTKTVVMFSAEASEVTKLHAFSQVKNSDRDIGTFFEKYVLDQLSRLRLKRVVHVNAKTIRWLKATRGVAPYVVQTVNPLLYRLLIDSDKLEMIRLSDEGVYPK